ncbi:MAG: radical SAM protein [Firmicutes bacterium]|nr:radical SAM protein [Bacillota bacterium]
MQMSFEQLAGKLLFNSLKYDRAKKTGEPLKLVAVSIAITGRCNSRCIHCRIWELSQKNPAAIKHEMTKEEICVYLSDQWFSDLVEIDLTGGEPYLRDDIEDIVAGIMALRKSKLTKLRTIIIPTNGLLTEKILSRMKVILSLLKGTGVDFVSVSSLDGLGRAHDLMRGTKGAFEKADKTIEGILKLREEYPDGFWPGIKTTITHYNVHELHSLLNYAVARSMFYIISPVIITKKRFRNEKFKDKFQLSIEDLKKIAEFYTNRKHEFDFYYQKVKYLLP